MGARGGIIHSQSQSYLPCEGFPKAVRHVRDDERVQHLRHHGADGGAEPQQLAFGHALDEAVQPDIGQLLRAARRGVWCREGVLASVRHHPGAGRHKRLDADACKAWCGVA